MNGELMSRRPTLLNAILSMNHDIPEWLREATMHPAVQHIMQYFKYDHLPEKLQATSKPLAVLAEQMAKDLPEGPELTAGLRKLLEAKDCFVRAALAKTEE